MKRFLETDLGYSGYLGKRDRVFRGRIVRQALLQRLADEKFQLARLVTAQGQAGLIIALDEQLRTAEIARQPRK